MDLSKMNKNELKKLHKETESIIFGPYPCFGVSDLRFLALLEKELHDRKPKKSRKLC